MQKALIFLILTVSVLVNAAPKSKNSRPAPGPRKPASAPRGVATELPPKRVVTPSTPTPSIGAMPVASAPRLNTIALPRGEDQSRLVTSVSLTFGSVNRTAVNGNQDLAFSTLQPLIRYDFAPGFSTYGTVPLNWYSFSSTGENIQVLNRPELGVFTTVINNEFYVLGLGIAASLPIFETSWNRSIAERQRRWQIAPGVTFDMQLSDWDYRFFAATRLAFETSSQFTSFSPLGDQSIATMNYAPAIRGSVGIYRDADWGRVGLAAHIHNGLGKSRVKKDVVVQEEIGAPALMVGEIFGNYAIAEKTDLAASFTAGLKTDSPGPLLLWLDYPRDTASLAFNLSLNQSF